MADWQSRTLRTLLRHKGSGVERLQQKMVSSISLFLHRSIWSSIVYSILFKTFYDFVIHYDNEYIYIYTNMCKYMYTYKYVHIYIYTHYIYTWLYMYIIDTLLINNFSIYIYTHSSAWRSLGNHSTKCHGPQVGWHRCDLRWCGGKWHGWISHGLMWFIVYNMVLIWFDMISYGFIWFSMVRLVWFDQSWGTVERQ